MEVEMEDSQLSSLIITHISFLKFTRLYNNFLYLSYDAFDSGVTNRQLLGQSYGKWPGGAEFFKHPTKFG
jgi:hypothetical protein